MPLGTEGCKTYNLTGNYSDSSQPPPTHQGVPENQTKIESSIRYTRLLVAQVACGSGWKPPAPYRAAK
jgi:hypothetical protein